jgi:hypothetical protein
MEDAMRRNGSLGATAAALSLAILVASPAAARLPAEASQGGDYQSGDYGRIRYQINGLSVMRAELNLQSPAGINSPIYPGDAVQTAFDQRAEVELAGGSLVRVDAGTELTFLALPDPYASFQDNTVLQLAVGAIRVNTRLSGSEEFRIDTPAGSIYLLGDGDFRVEVSGTGHTRVVSRRGVAEAGGELGSVLVRGGMHTEIYPNSLPAQPEPFNTFASDGFDRWVEERQSAYRYAEGYGSGYGDPQVYEALPPEVQPYYGELESHGDWVYAEDYGYVWTPTSVGAGWRPYYDGYWDYGPEGYFWVSSEPWGWAPYHYGRWVRAPRFGWCWAPGRIFGGAWVAWSWGTTWVGWAPLDYWNRPAFYGTPYYEYYDARSWTFVRHVDLGGHRYDHYPGRETAPGVGGELRTAALVTRPPRVAPEQLAGSTSARVAAAREAQGSPRIASPSTAGSRPAEADFRTTEARMAARGDLRRTVTRPKAAAVEPRFDASRRRSSPPVTSSPPAIAGGYSDPQPRSVVRTPRRIASDPPAAARSGSRTRSEPRSAPPPRTSSSGYDVRQRSVSGAPVRTVTPQADPGRNRTGPRGEDLRELYRRISEPRITLKRSETSGSSSKRVTGSSRKKAPTVRTPTRSGGSRSSTAKPSRPRSTPRTSGGSRKSSSGSQKKSNGSSRGGRRR